MASIETPSVSKRLYNTPIEVGLRSLIILREHGARMDAERLMYLDFISLNTGDFSGPESLHAPIKHRGVQIVARRELIKQGLTILLSKSLVDFHHDVSGFNYSISDIGEKFLAYFSTKYYTDLVSRVKWTVSHFSHSDTKEIDEMLKTSLLSWGPEFLSNDNLAQS